jgi:CrcB protein
VTGTRRRVDPTVLGVVALGGAAGALLRHALTTLAPGDAGGFPWTVFGINVVGCALIAALPRVTVVRRRPLLSPLLGTGVLGGFTTLSTYAEQSRALVDTGHPATAAAYVVGTLAACLLAVALVSRSDDARRSGSEDRGGAG